MSDLVHQLNWLDYLLLFILAASLAASLARGFTREILGFVALVLGLLLGMWFHGTVGGFLLPYVSEPAIASFLGFCAIFCAVTVIGGVVGYVMSKAMKMAGLSLIDRLAGGAFGLVKGALFGAVILFAMLAFAPGGPPRSVSSSVVAPYVMWSADVLAPLAPRELKDVVERNGERLREMWRNTPLPPLPSLPGSAPKGSPPASPEGGSQQEPQPHRRPTQNRAALFPSPAAVTKGIL